MRKVLRSILIVSVLSMCLVSLVAYQGSCEVTVYITKTGEKYHVLGCQYLRESCIPISLTLAIEVGYTPCEVCRPPSGVVLKRPAPRIPRAADYHVKGQILHQQGQFEDAIKCFDRAIEINPKSAHVHNARGLSYRELGNLDKAIYDFSRAIELWIGFADAYYNRGIAYFQLEQYDQALKDFQQAKYFFPDEQGKLKCEKSIEEIEEIEKIKAKKSE